MNWFYRWMLKRIAREIVIQGPSHKGNIREYYAIIGDAARTEFYEDNMVTLDGFLSECHRDSMHDQYAKEGERCRALFGSKG